MLTRNKFNYLRSVNQKPCVSIYIPTEKTGDYEANRIRWKNALNAAKHQLEEKGFEAKLLRGAFEMDSENEVWSHQAEGLAAFITQEGMHLIQLMEKPEPFVQVDDHFHLGMLVRELALNHAVYVLALSRNSVKLYRANACMIKGIHIADNVVLSEAEALRNIEEGQSHQHHSTGSENASHHANSSRSELDNVRLEQFLTRVDDGLREVIKDKDTPLVLAAVEEYLPRYKKVTGYGNVSDFMIRGNPDQKSAHDLHIALQDYYTKKAQKDIAAFKENYGEKEPQGLTVDHLNEIAEMANYKNVDSLLLGKVGYQQLDDKQKAVLDNAIVSVCESGGTVLYTDNADADIKAILRFEMQTS